MSKLPAVSALLLVSAAAPARSGDFHRLDLSDRMAMVAQRKPAKDGIARIDRLELSLLELPLDTDLNTVALAIEPVPLSDPLALKALLEMPLRPVALPPVAAPSRFQFFRRITGFLKKTPNPFD